jgi:hypothetical protein
MSAVGAPAAALRQAPVRSLRRLILALVRVEGIRLLRHPIFVGGAALSAALLFRASRGEPGTSYFVLVFLGLVPLGAATLFVTNLAALRSRRHGTDDLYAALPGPARARTAALLLATVFTVPVSLALVAADYVYLDAGSGLELTWAHASAAPSLAELAQGPVAVVVLGVLGVALARFVPSSVVAPVAAVLVVAAEYALGGSNWPFEGTQARWLLPFADASVSPAGTYWPCWQSPEAMPCAVERFATASAGWHLFYLAGSGVLFAALAVLRHARRPLPLLALGVATAAMVGAGLAQLP